MPRKSQPKKPLRFSATATAKSGARTQFAALPFRRKKSDVEVLIISSLDSGRWIIPKGWPMDGLTPAQAAAQEAWEEAGVCGRIYDACIGTYSYSKWLDEDLLLPCIVPVFGIEVRKLDEDFPEANRRKRKWVSRKKAASRVREPELKQLIRSFDPMRLR